MQAAIRSGSFVILDGHSGIDTGGEREGGYSPPPPPPTSLNLPILVATTLLWSSELVFWRDLYITFCTFYVTPPPQRNSCTSSCHYNMFQTIACIGYIAPLPPLSLPLLPSPPSQVLGEAGALITTHAMKGEIEAFGKAVDSTAIAVCQLTEASAQAAYLVGIADPNSTAAIPGLVDQTQFNRASQV